MTTIASFSAHPPPRTARVVAALSLLLLAWALAVLWVSPDLVQGVRMVIRLTARTSLVFFLLAFTVSSLLKLWPTEGTAWLLRHRRAFGLAFAASHALHLVAIISFARLDGPGFAQQTSIANMLTGGLAYGFIALMAATSWNGAVRWMGAQQWQRLQTVGAYYLWVSFAVSFGKRIPVSAGYVLPVAVLVLALLLRWSAVYRARRLAQ